MKVLRRYLLYILCSQPVCYALIKGGGKTIKALIASINSIVLNGIQVHRHIRLSKAIFCKTSCCRLSFNIMENWPKPYCSCSCSLTLDFMHGSCHNAKQRGRSTSNLHFYDLHTSSYKMIYFLSNIYMWTLILLMVESSSAVFAIYFTQSAGLLCPD